jgi:exodeoxyribonuclease VII small subunit
VTGGDESLSYEELVEALEELTRRMADGAIGIEEVVELYERAGRLHALAAERLARVQARIDALAPEEGAGDQA